MPHHFFFKAVLLHHSQDSSQLAPSKTPSYSYLIHLLSMILQASKLVCPNTQKHQNVHPYSYYLCTSDPWKSPIGRIPTILLHCHFSIPFVYSPLPTSMCEIVAAQCAPFLCFSVSSYLFLSLLTLKEKQA